MESIHLPRDGQTPTYIYKIGFSEEHPRGGRYQRIDLAGATADPMRAPIAVPANDTYPDGCVRIPIVGGLRTITAGHFPDRQLGAGNTVVLSTVSDYRHLRDVDLLQVRGHIIDGETDDGSVTHVAQAFANREVNYAGAWTSATVVGADNLSRVGTALERVNSARDPGVQLVLSGIASLAAARL